MCCRAVISSISFPSADWERSACLVNNPEKNVKEKKKTKRPQLTPRQTNINRIILLRDCANFIGHIVSVRVVVPQQMLFVRSVTLGDWHSFLPSLSLTHPPPAAQASHYFRLHVYLHNIIIIIMVPSSGVGLGIQNERPQNISWTLSFRLSPLDALLTIFFRYFCEECIDPFCMIPSAKKSADEKKKCFNRSITFVDDSEEKKYYFNVRLCSSHGGSFVYAKYVCDVYRSQFYRAALYTWYTQTISFAILFM